MEIKEIQEKFERNLCKMVNATLYLLHANDLLIFQTKFLLDVVLKWQLL